MRSVAAKFMLPLVVLGLAFAGFLLYRSYMTSHQHLTEVTERQADLVMEYNLAVRAYVAEEIRPLVTSLVGQDDFIPKAMSTSYVSRRVFEKVREKYPELIIKFSSDNPRNPINMASPDELRMIKYFNAHPDIDRVESTIKVGGHEYLAHFTARRMEESCLRCHGEPQNAPKSLIEQYGATAGFHRPLGSIIALDTVAIPMRDIQATLNRHTIRQSATMLGGLLLLLAAIAAVFRLVVSQRLRRIAHHFRSVAYQADGARLVPVEVQGRDDVADLATSFNALVNRLQQTYDSLEKRVAERTSALKQSNDDLEREIAERRRAELQLRNAKSVAEAATHAKSEFLANMSHEIRTPMTAILGFADILLEAGDSEEVLSTRLEAARTIKINGEYLLGIINDILDLSKIEEGRMTVERIPCSPRTIVDEVASLMKVRTDSKGLELHIEYEGTIPATIRTDPTRLRQILLNVCANAIKFTNTGQVCIAVRLAGGDSPEMQFDIIDTGIGMTEEQLPKLFQPFCQADSSTTRRFGGTGLGLTISKKLAILLEGDVVLLATKPGAGTSFRVTVPTGSLEGVALTEDRPEPSPAAAESGAASETTSHPLAGRRILLAEDGADNQRLISHILKKAGARVAAVENGQLAVEAAFRTSPDEAAFDAILMDMQMPVMDGYDATRELRSRGYTGPIIALTAHAMSSDRTRCIEAGCDEYATKPIDRKKLIEAVFSCIARGDMKRPLIQAGTQAP
ncbi:MAG: DUF3365 domain-containing protein [Phycisphaerae bacterium]|nr:DUF3365 domain-containing protein [Phycisphaerae bacterium]